MDVLNNSKLGKQPNLGIKTWLLKLNTIPCTNQRSQVVSVNESRASRGINIWHQI